MELPAVVVSKLERCASLLLFSALILAPGYVLTKPAIPAAVPLAAMLVQAGIFGWWWWQAARDLLSPGESVWRPQ